MRSRFAFLVFGFLVLATGGCHRPGAPSRDLSEYSATRATHAGLVATSYEPNAPPEQERVSGLGLRRYIAEGHRIDMIAPEAQLQNSWEALVAYCGTIQCEIVSSGFSSRTDDSAPTGNISLRAAPGEETRLIAYAGRLGKIVQHTTTREDKAAPVVDTDAKIKNLTSFRDNLRAMLARSSATVKDSIEIQHQLADVQANLDFETGQRKILANETEKVAFEFSFQVEKTFSNAGSFAQIGNALRQSSRVFAESIASLITLVVALLPWLVLIVPVFWILAKLWRRMRRDRLSEAAAPAAI
jgi:uncharacterized protein DUF4349